MSEPLTNITKQASQSIFSTQVFSTDKAILLSALLALTGVGFAAWRAQVLSKRQHTMTILLIPDNDDQYRQQLEKVRYLYADLNKANQLFINPKKQGNTIGKKFTDMELKTGLFDFLNHHENLAGNLFRNNMDENILRDVRSAFICGLFEKSAYYIDFIRSKYNNPKIYILLQWLYLRWSLYTPNFIQGLAEFIRGKEYYLNNEKSYLLKNLFSIKHPSYKAPMTAIEAVLYVKKHQQSVDQSTLENFRFRYFSSSEQKVMKDRIKKTVKDIKTYETLLKEFNKNCDKYI